MFEHSELDHRLRPGSSTTTRTSLLAALCLVCGICRGQDLTPRAYVITPIHTNAVILSYSYFNGGFVFDPTIPITNATSQTNVSALSLFHTLSFFGRSASLTGTCRTLRGCH
jgi:hypothetical protein